MQRRHLSRDPSSTCCRTPAKPLQATAATCAFRPAAWRITAVEVIIEDNGPGIPPESLERIFEAYYTTKEKGTGLGLATVKHNVELYGGTVRVESELGKGAHFILIFSRQDLGHMPTGQT